MWFGPVLFPSDADSLPLPIQPYLGPEPPFSLPIGPKFPGC